MKLVVTTVDAATGYVFTLTGLPYGPVPDGYTYYVSEETVDGYQSPKYYRVNGENLAQVMGISQIENEGTICNDQIGYELPQTGGEGTLLFSVFGTIFMLTATLGLMGRRNRKAEYAPRH